MTSGRLARGTLSAQAIVRATVRLLDAEGVAAFSMPRLGRELGASSTAMYRHFPSRDELLLEVADWLIGESLEGFTPSESWVETLRDLAMRVWGTCERHPAAFSLTYLRTTRRPHEMRAVDAIIGAVLEAGWRERDAILAYRGFASFVLGIAGAGATFLSLPEEQRAGDERAWLQVYGSFEGRRLPNLAVVAPYLAVDISPREVFEHQVAGYLAAMAARAPGAPPAP